MILQFSNFSDEETRQNHDECNDRRGRLYSRFVNNGWVWHCFNCGKSGFEKCSPAERGKNYAQKRNMKTETDEKNTTCELPSDYRPITKHKWLSDYGITEEECLAYRIGISEKMGRIILPIYDENELLLGYQARAIEKSNVKYITHKNTDKPLLFLSNRRDGDRVVIVEDILSAIKVGRVAPAIAILGSPERAGKGVKLKIRGYPLVIIWFDADKLKSGLLWASHLKCLGHDTSVVWTDRDPKEYPDRFIAKKVYK